MVFQNVLLWCNMFWGLKVAETQCFENMYLICLTFVILVLAVFWNFDKFVIWTILAIIKTCLVSTTSLSLGPISLHFMTE